MKRHQFDDESLPRIFNGRAIDTSTSRYDRLVSDRGIVVKFLDDTPEWSFIVGDTSVYNCV
jgi:hypothetical protein